MFYLYFIRFNETVKKLNIIIYYMNDTNKTFNYCIMKYFRILLLYERSLNVLQH